MVHETSGHIEGAHSSVPHCMHRRDIDLFHHSTDKDPGPIYATVVRNVQLLSTVDHLSGPHWMGYVQGEAVRAPSHLDARRRCEDRVAYVVRDLLAATHGSPLEAPVTGSPCHGCVGHSARIIMKDVTNLRVPRRPFAVESR